MTEKIYSGTGRLRYKLLRRFDNVHVLDKQCNVVVKQVRYCDPANHEPDEAKQVLPFFLERNQTGILVTTASAFAFWRTDNEEFFMFDPYPCDENGQPDTEVVTNF